MDLWEEVFNRGLKEDRVHWDWTTRDSLQDREAGVRAQLIAKAPGVFVGRGLLDLISSTLTVETKLKDGASVKKGDVIARLSGKAADLLGKERTILNLLGYVSGIATRTREMVKIIESKGLKQAPRLTCTRKTLPYYKDLAVHAVIAGGGFPHRMDLSSGILIKENHIAAAKGLRAALSKVRKTAPHGLRIEVEVRSISELRVAISEGADGALLDHFSVTDAKKATSIKEDQKFFLEISGNIDESNLLDYCIEGIDLISSGSLTHSVKSLDLSLMVDSAR